jgi:hypothetical protein
VNRIIVEGKNDKGFIEAYKQYLISKNINLQFDLSTLANGLSEASIIDELKTIKNDLENEPSLNIKIGFILDIDDINAKGYINRFTILNNAILSVFEIRPNLSDVLTSAICEYEDLRIEFSYLLMQNSKGNGELIDVLKEIKFNDSLIADCVNNCFQQKVDYTAKEISDDWLHIFLKWDSCNYTERRASKNFGLDKKETIEKLHTIFNFENNVLENLKKYLSTFSNV